MFESGIQTLICKFYDKSTNFKKVLICQEMIFLEEF